VTRKNKATREREDIERGYNGTTPITRSKRAGDWSGKRTQAQSVVAGKVPIALTVIVCCRFSRKHSVQIALFFSSVDQIHLLSCLIPTCQQPLHNINGGNEGRKVDSNMPLVITSSGSKKKMSSCPWLTLHSYPPSL
jgi:hypothetical protein